MSNGRSPLEALQQRASLFNQGDAKPVRAEVRVLRAEGREIFGEISTVGNDHYQHHSQYQFYLLAPYPNCSAPYLLFEAWHHILFKPWYHSTEEYPVRIKVAGEESTIELESEEELLSRTDVILRSERTNQIIRSLSG